MPVGELRHHSERSALLQTSGGHRKIKIMLDFIAAIVLLLLALIAIILQKTYDYLPEVELKRQARKGNQTARLLYRAVAYGSNLRLLLWLLIGLFAGLGLTLFVRVAPFYLGVATVALILWLGFAWLPSSRLTKAGEYMSRWCTPAIVWLLNLVQPLSSRLTSRWYHRFPLFNHNGVYERDDLLAIIAQQRAQTDNRIAPEILDLVEHALQFDRYAVRDIVRPRQKLRVVSADEAVGPILLDELHATGQRDFPVYRGKPDQIVATLHLITLDEAKHGGKVLDYSDHNVAYLHEADSLAAAMQAVYKTRQQLFIVIDSFDDFVGVVALEDILQALLGAPGEADFDFHHDRAAVARKHQPAASDEPDVELLPETPETVVE